MFLVEQRLRNSQPRVLVEKLNGDHLTTKLDSLACCDFDDLDIDDHNDHKDDMKMDSDDRQNYNSVFHERTEKHRDKNIYGNNVSQM